MDADQHIRDMIDAAAKAIEHQWEGGCQVCYNPDRRPKAFAAECPSTRLFDVIREAHKHLEEPTT